MKIIENEIMANHTTYRIGGPAKFFCEPHNLDELAETVEWAKRNSITYRIISNGSNILISDKGVDCLIIKIKNFFKGLQIFESSALVGSGCPLHQCIEDLAAQGFGGFEKLACIPGSMAGAIVMNAGAYGVSIGKFVAYVEAYCPGEGIIKLKREDINFGYRQSIFQRKNDLIITRVELQIEKKDKAILEATISDIKAKRKRHPTLPSCGSVFRNPSDGRFAGAIIEELGLKGTIIGDAQISLQHSNFIVNLGNASAEDVFSLICLVKQNARLKMNIELETEVKLWGDFS